MAYVDGLEYVDSVFPIEPALYELFLKGGGLPPLGAEGPIAVLWMGDKVALVAETGETNVIEKGMWVTYHLERE